MYFLNPSLLTKHTPLITTASPGNYENPPRINPMQKSVNQKYTVRHLIVALQFYLIPRTVCLGKDRNPCEVPFNWAISCPGFSKFGNLIELSGVDCTWLGKNMGKICCYQAVLGLPEAKRLLLFS